MRNTIGKRTAAFVIVLSMAFALISALDPAVMRVSAKTDLTLRLSDSDRAIYEQLRDGVIEAATGKTTSTIFTVDVSASVKGGKYTASQLGVSSLLENGEISEDAVWALMDIDVPFDFDMIYLALVNTLPYHLYWFDITGGLAYSSTGVAYDKVNGKNVVFVDDETTPTMEFYFCAAKEFRVGDDEEVGIYTLKSDIGKAVAAAVETRAQAVVAANAGKSDYEKLVAYRNYICDAVNYNDEAVENENTPYGNPWQLYWIFDDNPDTNIVCEGYAKGYKYLCDLTDFSSDQIDVILMTGDMDGGAHMWNQATMEDGRHYLIDITNCDEDSVGYPLELFLRGYNSSSRVKRDSYYEEGKRYSTTQYTYKVDRDSVPYAFDEDALLFYTADELTIANKDYDPTLYTAKIVSRSIELTGDIGVNFYLDLPAHFLEGSGNYILVNDTTKIDPATLEVSGSYRKLTWEVTPKQLHDEIRLQLFYANDKPYGLYDPAGNDVTSGYSFSVYEYIELARTNGASDQKLMTLVDSVEQYGNYAQLYFGYNTESAEETPEMRAAISAVSASDLASYAPEVAAGGEVRLIGGTLTLNGNTTLRQYLTIPSGKTAADYAFYVDGVKVTPEESAAGGCLVLSVKDIPAQELDTPHSFTVKDPGTEEILVSVTDYSAMSYVYHQLPRSTDERLTHLLKSMYLFYSAAEAYFAAN